MLHNQDTYDACIHQTTSPVTPAKSRNCHGEKKTKDENYESVVAVLPRYKTVVISTQLTHMEEKLVGRLTSR